MYQEHKEEDGLLPAISMDLPAPPARDVEEVFRSHYAMVFRTAYRVTGSVSDAEDVLQTVFMRLIRRDPRAESVGNVESYLRRAATNAALDVVRSRASRRPVALDDVESRLLQDASHSPEQKHSSSQLHAWLRSAVARLSPRSAEIFTLRYIEGYDNSEIARILKTSQAVIAVTLHRTRSRLKRELLSFVGGKS